MKKPLGIGVVGVGGMGLTHAGAYMLDERVRVIAGCDADQTKLKDFVEGNWPKVSYYEGRFDPLYKIARGYVDYRELVKDPDVDAISVCTPNKFHYPIAKEALEHGKHVLVEKPMTLNYKEARDLVALAGRNERLLAVGHVWRLHPHVQYAKEIVKTGILGDIIKLKGYGIHEYWIPTAKGFTDPEIAGGGALIDMGIHPIDTIRFLLEGVPVTKVYAEMTTAYGKYEVEDIGVVLAKFSNGAFAVVEFGWGNPHKDGVESSIQIFGTKGYMRIFPTILKYTVNGVTGVFKPNLEKGHLTKELYAREITHFIDSILGETRCVISAEEEAETMKVIDAAYLSSKEGRVVSLKEYEKAG